MKSVDLMSACMTITVVWNLYGFATNFFESHPELVCSPIH